MNTRKLLADLLAQFCVALLILTMLACFMAVQP